MNNFYRKVAVTFVGIALGFVLEANKEAKAAMITLQSTTAFSAVDSNADGLGDEYFRGSSLRVQEVFSSLDLHRVAVYTAFYEFNIATSSLTSNTTITEAIFQVTANIIFPRPRFAFNLNLFGYKGNGEPNASDFEVKKRYLGYYSPPRDPLTSVILRFNVTSFVNELAKNNDAFGGFAIEANGFGGAAEFNNDASLIITTEPVHEPTTIFGSAIGLCLGGWLKRRKSAPRNKTTSQN